MEEKNISCKYCTRKPIFESTGRFYEWENEEFVAIEDWIQIAIGVNEQGRFRITAHGENSVDYYPNYCPECGRKLQ